MLDDSLPGVGRGVYHIEREGEKESPLRKSGRSSGSEKKKDEDTIIFLHLSDVHLDRDYSEVGLLPSQTHPISPLPCSLLCRALLPIVSSTCAAGAGIMEL